MNKKLEILQVSRLFNNVKYEIPIYQRNYAWGENQIQQLIDDIYDSNGTYFLGNLIVNQKNTGVYEVIDGQQRLTTLYLLEKYLNMDFFNGSLCFEAREKSNRTLSIIGTEERSNLLDELQSKELINGYKMIEDYFKSKMIKNQDFREKLDNVQLIRIQVPQNIDLNHYFEIMNTRGEQLELHEIAKAKLLSKLSTDEDKKAGALIWDACSNMDSYVQMNFDSKIRKSLFTKDWSGLKSEVSNFDKVKEKVIDEEEYSLFNSSRTLIEILQNPQTHKNDASKISEENERFESIISFPNFILQVNKTISEDNENESMLDDKNFLKNIELNWDNEEKAKNFIYNLLKCRVLFDKYIIKREFTKDYKETGKWSLQRLESYKDEKRGNSLKPKYIGTFGGDDNNNKQLRTLQSCLRITYTSPKTMHWISLVLRNLINDKNINILKLLEDYCVKKVKESDYEQASGFGFERIVFTYLDYILYRDGYSYKGKSIISKLDDDWYFQFRNSIEHFYPQHPIDTESFMKWEDEELNSFGNLALITVSGNSKFSNLPPEGKVTSYKGIIEQSLKLKVMKEMIYINDGIWNKEIVAIHKDEMFNILKNGQSHI
ncbi:DUF262 domain-containing protein [Clostridium cuniculi]|uniref:DUF262 domain-containing protein n=1 Tax=Clostridium cuniculi TaxID=2548455 RepID=UPI0010544F26|nr:DUF262 domain-containing protein [Clostridium cuniculi]